MSDTTKKHGAHVLMTYFNEEGVAVKTATISKEEFIKHFLPGFVEKKAAAPAPRDILAEGFGAHGGQ
jgi:hypothetical protein